VPSSDKRFKPRARIARKIRVRPSNPEEDDFEDISVSINASRDGVYFSSKRESYRVGLRLFVTYPYGEAHDPSNREYVAEVVRVETLREGTFGIALRLLSTI
jgi:hypothetical protein